MMRLHDVFNNRFSGSQAQQKSDEFGFTSRYTDKTRRVINKDGTFNVIRIGEKHLAFHQLLTMRWWRFFALVLLYYIVINLVFATLYMLIDSHGIGHSETYTVGNPFMVALFFSAQTLTTVGYGSLYPLNAAVSTVSAVEALFGLMMFAVFTGLMYGRVSRPVPGVRFSPKALIAPYRNGWSFQFRLANAMNNNLLELEAKALLSVVVTENGLSKRQYVPLDLDNGKASYLPLNWTLVHPINEKSPLSGMGPDDFRDGEVEILVMVRGFNDTFAQEIHARSSYRFDEIEWHKKFRLPYHFDTGGMTVFELEKLGDFEDIAV